MSQETHGGRWIAFRQPARRVAMERLGHKVRWTYEANPGEVWEELSSGPPCRGASIPTAAWASASISSRRTGRAR